VGGGGSTICCGFWETKCGRNGSSYPAPATNPEIYAIPSTPKNYAFTSKNNKELPKISCQVLKSGVLCLYAQVSQEAPNAQRKVA
jgi:hypothetical protein